MHTYGQVTREEIHVVHGRVDLSLVDRKLEVLYMKLTLTEAWRVAENILKYIFVTFYV